MSKGIGVATNHSESCETYGALQELQQPKKLLIHIIQIECIHLIVLNRSGFHSRTEVGMAKD